jgi:hypothetical protein
MPSIEEKVHALYGTVSENKAKGKLVSFLGNLVLAEQSTSGMPEWDAYHYHLSPPQNTYAIISCATLFHTYIYTHQSPLDFLLHLTDMISSNPEN